MNRQEKKWTFNEVNHYLLVTSILRKNNNEIGEALSKYMSDIKIFLDYLNEDELKGIKDETKKLMIDHLLVNEDYNGYAEDIMIMKILKNKGLSRLEALEQFYDMFLRSGAVIDSKFMQSFRQAKPHIDSLWKSDNHTI